MKHIKYPKIHRIWKDETDGLLYEDVIVQVKKLANPNLALLSLEEKQAVFRYKTPRGWNRTRKTFERDAEENAFVAWFLAEDHDWDVQMDFLTISKDEWAKRCWFNDVAHMDAVVELYENWKDVSNLKLDKYGVEDM
jgi:hypothetical protein